MIVLPHLILQRSGRILLIRRGPANTISPSHWHCVTGGIESGESPREAIIREAQEEIGIEINDINLETTVFVTEQDYYDPLRNVHILGLFFVSHLDSNQEPVNLEPARHDDLGWFDPHELPDPIVPGVALGIQSYFNNMRYIELRNVSP